MDRKDRAKYNTAHVADLQGRGAPDILLAQSGDDAAKAKRFKGFKDSRAIFNDGGGNWLRENTIQFPAGRWGYSTYTLGFAVEDVNSDGRNDVVMATQHNVPENYAWMGLELRLLLGDGGRTFTDVTAQSFWDQSSWDKQENILPTHIALPDLDADGAPDLVVSTLSPVRSEKPGEFPFVVAYNDGKGRFTPLDPEWLAPSYRGRQLWPADLNGDGRLDLVGLSLLGEMKNNEFYTRGVKIDYFENAKFQ